MVQFRVAETESGAMQRFRLVWGILALSVVIPMFPDRDQARPLDIISMRDLGVVGKPASVTVRDGGASGLIGGKVLWTFGDTLFSPTAVDGTNLRSNTAAL